jgi:hypothetical protein
MVARHCTPARDRNQQRPAQPLHIDSTCSTVSQSLSALSLQQWYTTAAACTIRARCTHSDCRHQQQHALNTTLPPRSDGGTCVRAAERTTRSNATNRKLRCVVAHPRWGEHGAATHKCTIATFQSRHCSLSTHAQHAQCALSVLTVCLQCTTQEPLWDPRNTQALTSLRADVTCSAQNSWQASRTTAISTCSSTSQLKA